MIISPPDTREGHEEVDEGPTDEVIQLNAPVDIFDDQNFDAVKKGQGIHSGKLTAAKADTIAHATKKVINEKMDEIIEKTMQIAKSRRQ